MKKIDTVVLKETGYIAIWSLILSALMQAVFLIIQGWDMTVLFGNILSVFVSVLNFFLMGITVQKAVIKEEKEAKSFMKLSHSLRTLILLVGVVIGVALPYFSTWTVIIPLFFPRIAMLFRPKFKGGNDG
ncbi:MAG: hypothetical protein IJZ93_02135 [Clostridia bacterium]|nr:hypothetical protein [Clostridia bacterium]